MAGGLSATRFSIYSECDKDRVKWKWFTLPKRNLRSLKANEIADLTIPVAYRSNINPIEWIEAEKFRYSLNMSTGLEKYSYQWPANLNWIRVFGQQYVTISALE